MMLKGWKLVFLKNTLLGLDPECRKALEEAIDTYKKLGAEIISVKMPHMKYGLAAYYIIAPAGASSNLSDLME